MSDHSEKPGYAQYVKPSEKQEDVMDKVIELFDPGAKSNVEQD